MKTHMAKLAGVLSVFFLLNLTSTLSLGTSIPEGISRQQSSKHQEFFSHRVAEIWGEQNVWNPSPTVWVQYETDLGERSAVDFEHGTVIVQLLIDSHQDPLSEEVIAHLHQGVRNLILGDAEDPVEMVILEEQKKKKPKDSAMENKSYVSHDLTLGYERKASTENPLLLDQIRRTNGKEVALDEVENFTNEVVNIRTISHKKVKGSDGINRQAVSVKFDLAPNHLEIRARQFYPIVKASALKYNLDPSIIMGIIHTESMFNPRARSQTPAFGLMQLVPGTGAREAYAKIHGISKSPSAKYLYDPQSNIQLGVAYFDILLNRYMNQIDHPESRTYCAVAAYNAGAANVGRAFTPYKSIKKASPVINKLQPSEVYDRLVEDLNIKEARLYTRKVLTRSVLYSSWN